MTRSREAPGVISGCEEDRNRVFLPNPPKSMIIVNYQTKSYTAEWSVVRRLFPVFALDSSLYHNSLKLKGSEEICLPTLMPSQI
jgi:hypothetical protein